METLYAKAPELRCFRWSEPQRAPHYEIVPTGQVFDGADEVMGYYRTSWAAFPDLRHGNVRCHVADDAIIVEFDLLGTNLGQFYGMPPKANAFGVPAIAVFFVDADASSTSAFTLIPPACWPRSGAATCSP